MSRFAVFSLVALGVFACAQGETVPSGDGGAAGDGGAPVTSGSSTTGKGAATGTTGSTSSSSTTAGSTTSTSTTSTTTTTTTTTTAATTTSGMMGCGPFELDCGDGTCVDLFSLCDGFQDCANGFDEDPLLCASGVPPEWICPTDYYNAADGCDCGCGATDPDCPSASSAVCDFCSDGCSLSACPGTIDPANNALCL